MAKVKFSALIAEMRKKLNGSVFARNRGGAYLRTKVTPVNPQSIAQVGARNLLTQFSQSWRSLTDAERLAWNGVVTQWATTDVFGDVVNPSGITLYIRLNINITLAGGTPLTTPPSPTGVTALGSVALTATATGDVFDVDTDLAAVPADTAAYLEATPMLSPGISNANSKFRTIATLSPATAFPNDAFANYIAKFGSLVPGQKVFVRVKYISQLTGEVSQSLVASAIVGA
jgi:hypothetical protein